MEFNFDAEIDAINAAFEKAAVIDAIAAVAEVKRREMIEMKIEQARVLRIIEREELVWRTAQERNRVLRAVQLAEAAEFADAVAGIPDINVPPSP